MNNSKEFTDRVEISVDWKALIVELLGQWKMILLIAFLSGLAVMLLLYQNDVKAYNTIEPSAEKQTSADQAYNAFEKSLNDNSREALMFLDVVDRTTVENVLREYQVCISHEEAYYNSIYMNLDPNRERRLVMEYALITNADEDSFKGALIQSYALSLKDRDLIEALGAVLKADSIDQYLDQLIFATDDDHHEIIGGDQGRMEIIAILPEEADAEAVKNLITDHISQRSIELGKQHAHNMELLASEEVWIVDEDLNYKKNDINNKIVALNKTLSTDKNALTQKQMQVYEYVVSSEAGMIEDGTKNLAQALESINGVEPPHLKITNFVGGLLLGLLAYICIFLLYVVCGGKIYSQKVAENLLQTYTLGNVYLPCRNTAIRRMFNSRIVKKLQSKNISSDLESLTNNISTACKLNNTDTITLLEISETEEERQLLEKLKSKLNDSISAKVKALDDCSDTEMLEMPPVVVSVCENHTRNKDLKAFLYRARYLHISIIGLIYASCEE